MTRQEVIVHPVFLRLSDGYKNFVTALMDNGNDKRAAAHLSWKCKDDASAEAMANKALRKPAVRYLVDEYLGVSLASRIPTRDELAAAAWERAQRTTDGNEAHKWFSMVKDVMGYNTKAQETPPPAPAPEAPDDTELMEELESRLDPGRSTAEVQN